MVSVEVNFGVTVGECLGGVKMRLRLNPWVLIWTIIALAFALIITWQDRGLTFFWDEWDVVWATIESPNFGVLQDNGGNFFPLSRVIFALEMWIFGTWYPGYIFVTSLIFGATTLAFNLTMDDGTRTRRILLTAFSLVYLSSTGVLFASSMGFMLKWGLSPLLAIISAAFFIRSRGGYEKRSRYLVLAWIFFALSWAAFSSSIALMALLIIGLIHMSPSRPQSAPLEIRLSALIAAMSIVALVVGIRVAELNPPLNPLIGNAQESLSSALSADPSSTLKLALASTFAGVVSVLTSLPLHDNDVNSWLIIAFNDYLVAIVGGSAVLIAGICAFKRSLPSSRVMIVFGLLFGTNLFISIARTPLIHRYQALWVFIAILFVFSVLNWFTKIDLKSLAHFVIALVVVAGAISTWHIAFNALAIGNIERDRSAADSSLLLDPSSCVAEASPNLEQFAPTISAPEVCTLLKMLEDRQWIVERQTVN